MNSVPENAPVATIETEEDYRRASARARKIAHFHVDTAEGLELAALRRAISLYETLRPAEPGLAP